MPVRVLSAARRRLGGPAARAGAEVAVVLMLVTALLLRRPAGGRLWRTLWAEDGRVFLACQQDHGLARCLSEPYTGYLQFWPRIGAALVEPVPVRRWALAAALISVALAAVSLTSIHRATAWLVPSRLVRLAAVAVLAGAAVTHWAPSGNLANLHWFLFVSGVFVAADPDASDVPGWVAARTAWLVTVCLSEALAPLVLVALVFGLVVRRVRTGSWSRAHLVSGAVVAVAAGAQVVSYLRHPRQAPPHSGTETFGRALHQYGQVLHDSWLGPNATGRQLGDVVLAVTAGLVLLGLVAVGVGAARSTLRLDRLLPLAAGLALELASLGTWEANVLVNDAVGARYLFVPFVFALMAAVTVVVNLFALSGLRYAVAVPGVAATVMAVAVLVPTPYRPLVATHQQAWRSQLDAARRTCALSGPGARVQVPIAPKASWTVPVPCRRIVP